MLVVVCVPRDPAEWLTHTPDRLVLRNCGYWQSLRGAEATTNTTVIRIRMPRSHVFDVANVQSLMGLVAERKKP